MLFVSSPDWGERSSTRGGNDIRDINDIVFKDVFSLFSFRTPAMIGCSFVVDREYFGQIGLLDPGMEVYGGENIELGMRVREDPPGIKGELFLCVCVLIVILFFCFFLILLKSS